MKRLMIAIHEALLQASFSLRTNKLRSFLTILGIVIGVMTVIGMVSIIQGLNSSMVSQLQSMGPHLIQFQSEEPVHFGEPTREQRMRKPLYYEDALAIRTQSPAIKAVSAEAYNYNVTLKYRNEETTGLEFGGVEPTFSECNNLYVDQGRFITDTDLQHATAVVVIGDEIANALFPGGVDPIGKMILANGHKFQVIGKFRKKGSAFLGSSRDRYVVIPFTSFRKIFPDVYRKNGLHIATIPKHPDLVPAAIDQGTTALRVHRGLKADKENDFAIMTPDNLIETYNQITGAIYLVMVVISSIGLMVGGVGVMNIMLVSVKERTREIGLRKALGARRQDILLQFLIEAVILCAIGGVLGIGAGAVVAWVVKTFSPLPATISVNAVLAAVAVSSSVGLFFGFYPARRAASQDPILALHYE
jgi:putative ABC transport system permease protein